MEREYKPEGCVNGRLKLGLGWERYGQCNKLLFWPMKWNRPNSLIRVPKSHKEYSYSGHTPSQLDTS